MKLNIITLICLLVLYHNNQSTAQELHNINSSNHPLSNHEILPENGVAPTSKTTNCISPEERIAIRAKLDENKAYLRKKGILKEANLKSSSTTVAFDWPLRKASHLTFDSYYFISNFVDHDPVATGTQYGSSNLDYNCGNRTYDKSSGYNHKGIDINPWPFPWYLYENDMVEVIAAEAGTIIAKFDGHDDDHCSCSGSWNAVYIVHADGSEAWYGHLKKNKLTSKAVGNPVAKGEYLGVVASSGCSTGPHLHFEVYDHLGNLVDPFSGSCNSMNSNSWWASQHPYRESTINVLLTHDAPPELGCITDENPNLENTFTPGQTIYFAVYYRDQTINENTVFTIRKPDNSIWQTWNFISPDTYNRGTKWYWNNKILPTNGPFGVWTFEAEHNGHMHYHEFEYIEDFSCPLNRTILDNPTNLDIITASNTISTSGLVTVDNGIQTTFKAGNATLLDIGFQAKEGAVFNAYIQNCNPPPSSKLDITQPIYNDTFITTYPNPFSTKTTISYTLSNKQNVSLSILSTTGQEIVHLLDNVAQGAGTHEVQFNGQDLPKGMYFYRFIDGTGTSHMGKMMLVD